MKIIVTQRAKNDISNIFNYNLMISPKYAIKIEKKLYLCIKYLKNTPYIGRYVFEIPDKHYRERICENYRIIYFVSEKENVIFIRYIFNVRQDKTNFFKEHKNEILNHFNKLF